MNSWPWRNGLLVAGGVVALGGGVWFLLRPTPVAVARVSLRDLGAAIQGVGTVEAKTVVQVGAKITGRVVSIFVDQGDPVKVGQDHVACSFQEGDRRWRHEESRFNRPDRRRRAGRPNG